MIGYEYSSSSMSPDVSAPKQHSGPQACHPSCCGVAPAPEMIVASTMVTYSSSWRLSQPAMFSPLAWPQLAATFEGTAFSKASRTASVSVSIGVVVQLKDALNVVWEVEESKESGLWHFARNYVLSFAAVLALGFLLLVSLLVTAGLAAAGKFIAPYLPEGILHLVSMLVSFAVVAVLFAMMFKWLPDVSVAWGDVWLGASLTALFFELGKAAIGFYIGKQGLESTYGAAAACWATAPPASPAASMDAPRIKSCFAVIVPPTGAIARLQLVSVLASRVRISRRAA